LACNRTNNATRTMISFLSEVVRDGGRILASVPLTD
jgi:hypothetical protein